MKKMYISFALTLVMSPLLVSADSYGGPYCFEDVSMNEKYSEFRPGENSIRGTCKEVKIYNSITLDPDLKKNYLLGTHESINESDCCSDWYKSKYSESLIIVSSSTISEEIEDTNSEPVQAAIFDKSFFIPTLAAIFKKDNIPFSEDTFPILNINIFQKEEFEKIDKTYISIYLPEHLKMDTLMANETYGYHASIAKYGIYTFRYQDYGKYIHAPKGELHESQYADFDNSKNILSNEELGIEIGHVKRDYVAHVSPTSPLVKITNNWLYTKRNGKLTLVWKNIEYHLNDGSTKTVTLNDKKVSSALILSSNSSLTNSSSSTLENDGGNSSASTTSIAILGQSKSFFQMLINFISSWFK